MHALAGFHADLFDLLVLAVFLVPELVAAVLVLFAMTDSSNMPVSSAPSNLALVGVDSSNALDSIAMRAQFGLGIEDSLLYRVNADSLR